MRTAILSLLSCFAALATALHAETPAPKPEVPAGYKDIGAQATYSASSLNYGYSDEKDTLLKGTCKKGYAFHTAYELNPLIVIDLKKSQRIDLVIIENRKDALPQRAKGLTMSVSNDGQKWSKVWVAPDIAPRWTVEPKGAQARYIRLETFPTTPDALHLQAVRIFSK